MKQISQEIYQEKSTSKLDVFLIILLLPIIFIAKSYKKMNKFFGLENDLAAQVMYYGPMLFAIATVALLKIVTGV